MACNFKITCIYLGQTFRTLLDLCQTSIQTVKNILKIICWKEMFTFLINMVVLDTRPFLLSPRTIYAILIQNIHFIRQILIWLTR